MTDFYEAVKGYTDIPIAVVSLVLGALSVKHKRQWGILFFLVGIASAMGTVVHSVSFSKGVKNGIWVFLYVLLFESVRRFTYLFLLYIENGEKHKERSLFVLEIVFYITAVIMLFIHGHIDIYIFSAFAGICIIKIVMTCIKEKRYPKTVKGLLLLLIPPVALQFFDGVIPFAVVFEHAFIIAELFAVYKISKE